MSDFSVKTQTLGQVAGQLSSASRRVDSIADEARTIIVRTRSSISSRLVEYGKASVIHSSVANCASDLRNLSKGINNAAEIYNRYEKNVMNKTFGKGAEASASSGKESSSAVNALLELLKKAGLLGTTLSAVDSFRKVIKGGKWTTVIKNGIDVVTDSWDVVKDWKKAFSNMRKLDNLKLPKGQIATIWAKKLTGFTDYFKAKGITVSKAKNFSTRWYNNYKKIEMDELADFGSKGMIIGTAISGIVNGISNYEEYESGEIDGVRAVMETIGETAVDIGKDAAIGIGVAATLATVFGGAPVIAVAAGTMIVSSGLDFVTDKLSGGKYDSFTEFASDSLLDLGEKIGDVATDVYNSVKDTAVNCFNKAKDGISAGWKKIFG